MRVFVTGGMDAVSAAELPVRPFPSAMSTGASPDVRSAPSFPFQLVNWQVPSSYGPVGGRARQATWRCRRFDG
jgi:hypothetical protein